MVLASRRSLMPTLAAARVRCTRDRRVSDARLPPASAATSVRLPPSRPTGRQGSHSVELNMRPPDGGLAPLTAWALVLARRRANLQCPTRSSARSRLRPRATTKVVSARRNVIGAHTNLSQGLEEPRFRSAPSGKITTSAQGLPSEGARESVAAMARAAKVQRMPLQ